MSNKKERSQPHAFLVGPASVPVIPELARCPHLWAAPLLTGPCGLHKGPVVYVLPEAVSAPLPGQPNRESVSALYVGVTDDLNERLGRHNRRVLSGVWRPFSTPLIVPCASWKDGLALETALIRLLQPEYNAERYKALSLSEKDVRVMRAHGIGQAGS